MGTGKSSYAHLMTSPMTGGALPLVAGNAPLGI
jgi:hypothetical protein